MLIRLRAAKNGFGTTSPIVSEYFRLSGKQRGSATLRDFRREAFVWVQRIVGRSAFRWPSVSWKSHTRACRSFVPLPSKQHRIVSSFVKTNKKKGFLCMCFQTIVELAETGSLDLSIFCSTCLVSCGRETRWTRQTQP